MPAGGGSDRVLCRAQTCAPVDGIAESLSDTAMA
jgi:hypothetical protein